MNRNRRIAACMFLVTILAVVTYRVWPRPLAADVYPRETITVGDAVREYRLVVPHSPPAEPVPIVFAFHGVGDSPESMAAYSSLDRLAAERGFIRVYPAARNSTWATSEFDPENLDSNPDVQFFDRLLEHLAGRFNVDPRRVYVVGMSNGATFAQLLAFARPTLAAVFAHSGPKPIGLKSAQRPFAIMLLAGADDPAARFMQSDAEDYGAQGHDVEFVIVPGLGHEWSTGHNPMMWMFLNQHEFIRTSAPQPPAVP